jgi:hypothetical protein
VVSRVAEKLFSRYSWFGPTLPNFAALGAFPKSGLAIYKMNVAFTLGTTARATVVRPRRFFIVPAAFLKHWHAVKFRGFVELWITEPATMRDWLAVRPINSVRTLPHNLSGGCYARQKKRADSKLKSAR